MSTVLFKSTVVVPDKGCHCHSPLARGLGPAVEVNDFSSRGTDFVKLYLFFSSNWESCWRPRIADNNVERREQLFLSV